MRIQFIRTVNGEIQLRKIVKRGQANAELAGQFARALGCRNTDHIKAVRHPLCQRVNEELRGRTGADPEPHARNDIVRRPFRRKFLELVAHSLSLRLPPPSDGRKPVIFLKAAGCLPWPVSAGPVTFPSSTGKAG